MKTTVDIPNELLQRAKAVALRRKSTLKVLIEEGLRLAIERFEQQGMVQIRPHVVAGASPPADVSWPRLRDVLYGDETSGLKL